MQRTFVLCFLVLLLPLAALATPQEAPTAPPQTVAPTVQAAPVCLNEILSPAPSSPDQGFTPSPIWRIPCCEADSECPACPPGRHPVCTLINTGCGRCACFNN